MKKTIPRRLGAALLAAALTLSLAVLPAAADDDTGGGGDTTPPATDTGTPETPETPEDKGDSDKKDDTEDKGDSDGKDDAGNSGGGLKLDQTTGQELSRGKSLEITAKGVSSVTWSVTSAVSGVDADEIVSWTSSGKTCTVTGVGPGKVKVKATAAARTEAASAEIEVEVSGLRLSEESVELLTGKSKTLEYQVFGAAKTAANIEWTSKNPTVADVRAGKITAYYPGATEIIAQAGSYKATCAVTVEEDVANAIELDADAGIEVDFADLISRFQSVCRERTGERLSYISALQVPTSQGILYYGYVSPDSPGTGVGSENYYISPSTSQRALSDVSFVSKTDYSGTAVISYTGRSEGGTSFSGSVRVTVKNTGDVTYSTASNRAVYFEAKDFSAICRAKTGKEIVSISFVQPSAKKGTLYYNYSPANSFNPEVTSDMSFYRTKSPYLDEIVFIPAENYTGTLDITYYCTTSGGTHSGKVTIVVYDADGTTEGKVEYSVAAGGSVKLDASDFNDVCEEETGSSLKYVYFDLPDADEGTLYYNYKSSTSYGSKVSSTTRYYRSSTPRLSYITFVAADNFSGTARIPFTGYSTSGDSFDGELVFHVDDSDGVIRYTSHYGETVEFNGADFNELCQDLNGTSLNYVCFELPASSRGILYRSSSHTSGSKAAASTKFYRSGGSYQIDDVEFVPNSSYTGTVSIPFSGYDTKGSRISGTVQIAVEDKTGDAVVTYQTVSGGLVQFDADGFDVACQFLTGERLNYVRFTLPGSSYGKLYYDYNASKGTGSSVSSSTSYYRTSGSRLLDNVSFLASESYTGTVTIKYTGMGKGGTSYSGEIQIKVSAPTGSTISYSGSSAPITLSVSDFESACSQMLGRSLSYLRFTSLPSSSAGRLYLNYSKPAQPGTAVAASTSYYPDTSPSIGQITFVPKADYQGTVSIPYTAWDTSGKSYSGTVQITISNSLCYTPFTDMGNYAWAKPAVEYLRRSGISSGYNSYTFGPGQNISRGEFALMIYRAFDLPSAGTAYSFSDVPTTSVYAEAVAAAKKLGIVQGENGRFNPNSPITRQSAMTMICRAMTATGKTVPTVSTAVLSAYSDGAQVSSYARSSVAALIYMGAVKGNSSMQLKPTAAISRAEMAVILHRVLTQ